MFKKLFISLLIFFGFLLTAHPSFALERKSVDIMPDGKTDLSTQNYKTSIDNLKKDGANHITFILLYQQDNIHSTTIYPNYNLPSDQALLDGITYAKSKGFNITLKPHVDPSDGEWRSKIDPTNRQLWFDNYEALLKHYIQLGNQAGGVEEICIGVEYTNMTFWPEFTPYWKNLIAHLRSVYPGQLTYSAHWNGEASFVKFWDDLDSIGIGTYNPISNHPDPTVSEMVANWKPIDDSYIQPILQKFNNKPIYFTEAGYRSINGASMEPWGGEPFGHVPDPGEQADAYDAMLSYWHDKPYVKGITFIGWTSNPNAGGLSDITFTPQNKPAEQILARWFNSVAPTTKITNVVSISNPCIDGGGIKITWINPTSGVQFHKIERTTDGTTWVLAGFTDGSAPTLASEFIDKNVSPDNFYAYRVTAAGTAQNPGYKEPIIQTQSTWAKASSCTNPPPPSSTNISNVVSSPNSCPAGGIKITWTNPSSGVLFHRIEKTQDGTSWVTAGYTDGSSPILASEFIDNSVTPDNFYAYRVVAAGTAQNPGYMTPVTQTQQTWAKTLDCTPPPPPIPGTIIFDDNLSFSWQDWSWDAENNFAVTNPVAQGLKALSFKAKNAWAGLRFHNNFSLDIKDQKSLNFSAQALTANQTYQIMLFKSGNQLAGKRILLSDFGGNPEAGTWKNYSIPLSAFELTDTNITDVVIQSLSESPQPDLYLDQIQFTN